MLRVQLLLSITALVLLTFTSTSMASNETGYQICMTGQQQQLDMCVAGCPGRNADNSVDPSRSQAFFACQKNCLNRYESRQKWCRDTNK